jgi:hypothetical protein
MQNNRFEGIVRPIREIAEQTARWTQPKALAREYELRAGNEVVATLRWQKTLGSLALAESADGAWTFKRSGFLSPRITVRRPDSEADVGVFKPGWRGEGMLRLLEGRGYQWLNTSFWHSEWAFADEAGKPLVHFKTEFEPAAVFAIFKHAAEVTFEPSAFSVLDLSLLTLLGWYLMVLMSEDAAGATAGVVVGS